MLMHKTPKSVIRQACASPLVRMALLAAVGCACSFGATVLYTNPTNNADTSYYSNYPIQLHATAFSIAGGGTVTQATFEGVFLGTLDTGFYAGFYADAGGSPGALLASTTGTATVTDTSSLGPYSLERYQITLDLTSFTAAPGATYFFAAGDTGSSVSFAWSRDFNGYASAFSLNGGAWSEGYGSGFVLLGDTAAAPEPATFALGGIAMIGALAFRRRRDRN